MQLAEAIGAEIISLDSMAVYRGMDIGTAKPSAEERSRVCHHLLDVLDPHREFSLAEYLTRAHVVVQEIVARGNKPLFVGGTPLYLKSLVRGVCEGPPADPAFRRAIEQELETVGIEALRQRLEQIDPLSAAKLHPNDRRRMVRALEVYKLTGTPISHYQMQFEADNPVRGSRVFVLSWNRSELHDRIDSRVEKMFASGFVDEVRGLLRRYGALSGTALQGVGYREVIEMLEGKISEADAIEQTKIRTRRFARRQETWFRGIEECRWVAVQSNSNDDEIVAQLREED